MDLDLYLEGLFRKKIPGGRILTVAAKSYKQCLGRAQATMPYNKSALACYTQRLTFLRTNLFGCEKSSRPEKCKQLVNGEIERVKDRIQLHRNRLAGFAG